MTRCRMKIEEVFPNALTTGAILKAVSSKYTNFAAGIGLNDANIFSFDTWYISMSGEKPISKLLQMLTDSNRLTLVMDSGERLIIDNASNLVGVKGLINLDSNALADVIYQMFFENWKRLSETFSLQYDTVQPYSMDVTEGGTLNRTSSNNNTSNGTEEGGSENNNTTENKRSAFNSETYQPNNMGTDDTTSSYNNKRNSTWGGSSTGDVRTARTIKRKGNIGNKTTQEILQEERELRLRVFWDYIRKDLDRVLTLPIYF